VAPAGAPTCNLKATLEALSSWEAASLSIIALWKPYGTVSRFTPQARHPGLAELVPVPGVWPIGRLDHDSEGLLLLGDDGRLARALTDPACAHPRTYHVQVEGEPDAAALDALARGVVVQGRRTRPARVRRLRAEPALPPRPVPIRFRKSVPTSWIELVLVEGRNRQVRRMTAAVGHPTLRLVRVAIGALRLAALGLAPGQWRELTPDEERALRAGVRRDPEPSGRPRRPAPRPRSRRPRARGGARG
jgi:23S rRNA pseudouridine2457 synthase